MDLQEFIDRERREAVAKAEEEKNKLSDQLKATVAERDKVSEKLDITTAERDKATAERDQIRIDQRNYQELTSILIDKNLFDELKHAAEDEAYRESLYVEYGVKPAQD
jgi:predicted transcriptional regulator